MNSPSFITDQKGKISVPTKESLDEAKAALTKSLAALNKYLNTFGKVAPAWKTYLQIEELQTQLAAAEPDIDSLTDIQGKFIANKAGLELKPILDTGNALRKYNTLLEIATSEKADEEAKKTIDDVSARLAKYAASPTREQAETLGESLGLSLIHI